MAEKIIETKDYKLVRFKVGFFDPKTSFEPNQELDKLLKTYKNGVVLVFHLNKTNNNLTIFPKYPTPLNFEISKMAKASKTSTKIERYTLPDLFCTDKNEKERVWTVYAEGGKEIKSYGEVGGKMIPSVREFKGVNIGKANATDAVEQAKREAERDWVKQLDKGYAPKSEEGREMYQRILEKKQEQGNTNSKVAESIRGDRVSTLKPVPKKPKEAMSKEKSDNGVIDGYETSFYPMHCEKWLNEPKCLKYFDFKKGVFIQPKLDGVRCLVRIANGKVVFLSRNGKQLVWLNHLRKEVLQFLGDNKDIILDCEVYADTIYGSVVYDKKKKVYVKSETELEDSQRFDVISGCARPVRGSPHELEDQLCLHVFDLADESSEISQTDRFKMLDKLFAKKGKAYPHLIKVETKTIKSVEDIKSYHDEVATKGYEGVVIRSHDLYYVSQSRSLYMRKYKYFVDDEFKIVDVVCDEGVDRQYFRWVCEKEVGDETKTFTVTPKATREQKWDYYDHQNEYIGKLLTVKYQELTSGGVPKFGNGVSIRDYE